jgi:bifunctional UDP-N-acetylglucosamine pyrophosphorylase/glucosamine-1-phosphate N-acetyltransferase
MSTLHVVILAAGKGTRMVSSLPKVLHDLSGKPLVGHVIDTAHALNAAAVHAIIGHGAQALRDRFARESVNWVLQAEQKGTGHAVQQAMPSIPDEALVLVLYGDVPLIRVETLQALIAAARDKSLALLTATLPMGAAYGRIVRDNNGRVLKIVEKKDASAEELKIREINTGFLAANAGLLRAWLSKLKNNNTQGEYYLTDIVAMAVADGVPVVTAAPRALHEILGVNSKVELAELERSHQNDIAQKLLAQGVTLRDPARVDVRGELACGKDVTIDVNAIFEGRVTLGDNVTIGANCVIRDCTIGAGTRVEPNCVLEESFVGADCRLGPFARLRPGARLADRVHVGNFVEVKKSELGEGSKANHLSYIGDTTIGKNVNVGAGTITCNYDGANKHRTVIGDNAFIGSNAALVAPVTVGAGATIGAGSVIAKEAPAGELTLTRAEQRTVKGWKRPVKKK